MPNNRNFAPITAAELNQAAANTAVMLQNATALMFNGTYFVDARNEGQEVVPIVPKDDFAKSLTPEQRGETPAYKHPGPELRTLGQLAQADAMLRRPLRTFARLPERALDRERARLIDQEFDEPAEVEPIQYWARGPRVGNQGA